MAGFVWQYEVRNSQISASGRLQDFRIGKLALQVSPGCHGLAGLALPIVQFISNFLPLYTLSLHLHLCNGKTQSSDKVLLTKSANAEGNTRARIVGSIGVAEKETHKRT